MVEFKYLLSVFIIAILIAILIYMIYFIRAHIPKGPYTWISNLYSFILFFIATVCICLVLVHISPVEREDEETLQMTNLMQQELSHVFSVTISKFVMFPLLVLEAMAVVCMNVYLLWVWYQTGKWNTVVNKFIIMQRIVIMSVQIATVIDYSIRLFTPQILISYSSANYCLGWLFIYQSFVYASICACLSAAVVRFLCVKFPLEYHNR
jgi:hypothetical protein